MNLVEAYRIFWEERPYGHPQWEEAFGIVRDSPYRGFHKTIWDLVTEGKIFEAHMYYLGGDDV